MVSEIMVTCVFGFSLQYSARRVVESPVSSDCVMPIFRWRMLFLRSLSAIFRFCHERVYTLGIFYQNFAVLGYFKFSVAAEKQFYFVFVFEIAYVLAYRRLR